MHAKIVQIASHWTMVFLCGKSRQPLLINKTSQWVYSRNEYVYSQIKLEVIDQIGLVQILLSNIVLTLDDPVTIPRKEYSFALALGLWLDNKCFCSFVIELVFKALRISW